MSRRLTILNKLQTLIAASPTFKSVKLVSSLPDKYPIDLNDTDMPAVKIIVPEESPDYTPGLRAMSHMKTELLMYSLEWNADSITAEEGALEALKNILGKEYTIAGTAVNINILKAFKEDSLYPLVRYRLLCDIMDEGSIETV